MNNKGQGIIEIMIMIIILSIVTAGSVQLMAAAALQQAILQRNQAWTLEQASVGAVLKNQASCNALSATFTLSPTLPQTVVINDAAGRTVATLGQQLGYQLVIYTVEAQPAGPAIPPTNLITLIEDGQSNNYKAQAPTNGDMVQQVRISIRASSPNKNYLQYYYINIIINQGMVKGCQI